MRNPSTAARALSISLAAAVLWTAPGLAAHAAAATIVRALPVAATLPAGAGSAFSAAPLPALSAASAPSLVSPLAAAAILPQSAAPVAALPPAAAAPAAVPAALAVLPAASASERPSALGSVRAAALPAPAAERPTVLGRLFDGALSGAGRLAMSVLPAAADGPDFERPAPGPGRARVTLAFDGAVPPTDFAAVLRRLDQYYGFRPEGAPSASEGRRIVTGTVPTGAVLALANAKEVREMTVLSGAPAPESGPRFKSAASRLMKAVTPAPAREPFTAATRKVADLEKLAKTDPEKAYALATEYITGRGETRREVRIAALRVLEAMPLAKVFPFYQKILTAYADEKVQNAKAAASDSVWYIQRAVLLRLARDAAEAKSLPDAVGLAKAQYQDRNASVRLAAASALRALGVDPGPENEHLAPSAAPASGDGPFATGPQSINSEINAYNDPMAPAAPGWGKRLLKALAVGSVIAAMLWGLWTVSQPPRSAPAPRPAVTQTVQAAATPAVSAAPSISAAKPDTAATDHQLLENIAKSEERIAKAQEAQLAAQQAAAKGGLFSGIGGMILSAMIFMGVFWLFGKIFKKMGGGASGGGMSASTETKAEVEKPTQRFSDIEGIDESLVDVQETLDYLRDPARFVRMGARSPKGILFEGPPGTGKTLMARALAGETNAAFFAVSGSDFVELFVGMGARRVRELITKAANHKPAIVFIDEIDAVGKARGAGGMSGSNDEREQTINALLTAMDGFDNSGGIIFVAATNRADTLDPALLRPGRFDRKIYVGKPHMGGREAIATIHAKDKRLAPELDLMYVARRTAGLAGADIQNIMNEAALQAIRRGSDAIGMEDVDEAIDRGTIGAKRSLPMPDALKRRIAYHEAGHVLANLLNENESVRQKVNKFTIVPHGSGALGFAEMGSEEGDKYLYTREELEARIDHALGGLVAEKLIYGKSEKIPAEWSTGPGSDLEMATNVARTMVQTLGMGEETGLAVTAPDRRDPMGRAPFGDAVAEKTWVEVNKILLASYKRVTERLTRNRHVLEALTQAVLTKETLIGDEIEEVVRQAGPVGPAAPPAAPTK
ncbi:MAG: ATP-dependent metallopeptidase FtsH/Yme1/Tma family protein [Elusimicrobiota bacterium]